MSLKFFPNKMLKNTLMFALHLTIFWHVHMLWYFGCSQHPPEAGRTRIAILFPIFQMRKWRHRAAERLAKYYCRCKGGLGPSPPGVQGRRAFLPSYRDPLRFLLLISLGGNEFHNSVSLSLLLRPLKPKAGVCCFSDPLAPCVPSAGITAAPRVFSPVLDTHWLQNGLHVLSPLPICFCLSP